MHPRRSMRAGWQSMPEEIRTLEPDRIPPEILLPSRRLVQKPSVLQPLYAALGKGVFQSPDFYRAVFPGTSVWNLYASAPA